MEVAAPTRVNLLRITPLLMAGCAMATPPEATSSVDVRPQTRSKRLREPAHLPIVARALLRERMATHGADMSDLVWAMLFVDTVSVEEIADDIARQPKIARPITHDATELSSRLPTEFFDLQDDLARRASALSRWARERDVDQMAQAYGELTTTCVRCHDAYMRGGPVRQ